MLVEWRDPKEGLMQKRNFKKLVAVFLGVGSLVLVAVTALAIWAGVAAFNYLSENVQAPAVSAQVEDLKNGFEQLPPLAKVGCWDKAQSLLNIEAWLERPVADNFNQLKLACAGAPEQSSET